MILKVREYLSMFGKVDERIIVAMENVDRKNFIAEKLADIQDVYRDDALPIGYGQTISQPSTVARMISLLNLKEDDKVLEVGVGSGWNAALIGFIVKNGEVVTTEICKELADRAAKKIFEAGIRNVKVVIDDFRNLKRRFNKIIFTAGINTWQEKIIVDYAENFLEEGGILVCPYEEGPLMILRKEGGKVDKKYTDEIYRFVPLILKL